MSNRDEMAALRSKIAQLELKHRIQRMAQTQKTELMGIKVQAAMEKKDQKMELMKMQAALEKKDQERDREADKNETQQQMENEKRDRQLENERRDRLMEKMQLEQKMEKKDLEQKMDNEKRDRLLENEKRDREADKKETQHQINQIKWEARLGQMEQQLHAAYRIQPLAHPAQYPARANLTQQRGSEELVPQRIQPRQLERREKETGPSHSIALAAAVQSSVQHSTAASTLLPSAARSSAPINSIDVVVAPEEARVSQHGQHQPAAAQLASNTPSRTIKLQQAHQQGPAAAVKAGPVSLPGDARMHFFLSHCQGTGGDQTNAIYLELKELGFSCWYRYL
jgi:hypothetical protein